MNLESYIPALIVQDIFERSRDLPTAIPTTRPELAQLKVHLAYAHAATAIGCAGPDVRRFLEWYGIHEKEIAALQERLDAVVADPDG